MTALAVLALPSFGNEMAIEGVVGVKAEADAARVARMAVVLENIVKSLC